MAKNKPNPAAKPVPAPTAASTPSKVNPIIGLLALLAFVFVLYIPALSHGFTNWDDHGYVLDNPNIALTAKNLQAIFTGFCMGNYHPLTMLSLSVDHAFGGTSNAFPYHLTNVLWHVLNTALVYFFSLRLSKGQHWVALFSAFFFAAHPMHVESVAWVSARKDVLYTAFFFGSLLAYLRYQEKGGYGYYTLSLALAVMACLSKPSAVVLPLVLLLLDWYQGWLSGARVWVEKLPFFLVSLLVGLVTTRAQEVAMHADGYSGLEKWVIGAYTYIMYMLKAFWWGKQSAFYPYEGNMVDLPGTYYYALPALAAVLAFSAYGFWRQRNAFFGLAFFTLNIFLVLRIVSVGGTLMAERYTYVPYIGLFFALGMYLFGLPEGNTKKALLACAVLFALACSVQTFRQIPVWKDSITLFSQAIAHYPASLNAYINRAQEYRARKQYDLALRDYDAAEKVQPEYNMIHRGRSLVYYDLKKYTEAIPSLKKVIEKGDTNAIFYKKLGDCYFYTGQNPAAIDTYNQALKLDPNDADLWHNRGSAYFNLQQYEAAIENYTTALRLKPDDQASHQDRGATYLTTARYAEALADFDAFLQKNPGSGIVHYYRSAALSRMGRKSEAKAAAEQAVKNGYTLPAGYLTGLQ